MKISWLQNKGLRKTKLLYVQINNNARRVKVK